jgi:anti-sigma factor RsiW
MVDEEDRNVPAGGRRCTDRSVRDLLGLYALGRLGPGDKARTSSHVGRCPSCAAESAGLRGLASVLDLLSPSDVADMVAPHAALRRTEV